MFFVVAIALFFILYPLWHKRMNQRKKLKWIGQAKGSFILENINDIRSTSEFLDVLSRHCENNNGLCWMEVYIKRVIIATDYKFLEFILSSTKILDKSDQYRFLHNWLGSGLLTANGSKWKKSRKMLTPAFHFTILEQFVDVFESKGRQMVEILQEKETDCLDIYPYVTLCTLDVICETAMGISIEAQKNNQQDYVHAVKEMCRIAIERSYHPIKIFDMLYYFSKDYYKEKKYLKTLHEHSTSVIKTRREELRKKKHTETNGNSNGKRKMAFLDLLLQSTIDGKSLTDREIRDEVETFMFEGHDTTASAISFTLYCLSLHREIQDRVMEEQKLIFGSNLDRNVTYQELQRMTYLEMVIKESLRLYPPVPVFARMPNEDIEYQDGKVLPADVGIVIFVFGAHRNPEVFPQPEKFDPSRFENVNKEMPFSYISFSAGQRNCIGKRFAMLKVKAIVSRVLRYFLLLPSGESPILVGEAVLKSKNGIKIRLKKRDWDSTNN